MLDEKYLNMAAESIADIWEKIEDWCIRDIVMRIMKAEEYGVGKLPATAAERAYVLKTAGMHMDELIRRISRMTGKSEAEVRKIFKNCGQKALDDDYERVYKQKGMERRLVEDSIVMKQLLDAAYRGTNGELHNFTRTSAVESQNFLVDSLDRAYWEISSGARSYTEVIREIIRDVGKHGMLVTYESGYKDSIETSVRRAVMTGLNKGTSQISVQNAAELGAEYMLVSSHLGARVCENDPVADHAGWQGKPYKIDGEDTYAPNLKKKTGFPDDPKGLCGYNCRHQLFPHFKGDPNPFKQYDSAENKKAYELSQKQRAKERAIRATKKELIAQKAAIEVCNDERLKFELTQDYDATRARLQRQNKAYNEFCENNGLKTQKERLQTAGWENLGNSESGGLKAGNTDGNTNARKLPQILETIDYKDREMIQSCIEKYEILIAEEKIENAIVITRKGNVYRCYGDLNSVYPDEDIAESLEGAYVTHNHPIGSDNEYSFSKTDIGLFEKCNLTVLRGVDEKYIYELTKENSCTDECMMIEDLIYTDGDFARHERVIDYAKEHGYGYRRKKKGMSQSVWDSFSEDKKREIDKELHDIYRWANEEEDKILARLKAEGKYKGGLDGEYPELREVNKICREKVYALAEKYDLKKENGTLN